jgi:hypothetical protein
VISYTERRIKFSLNGFSDSPRIRLRAQPLESSLGRVPQAVDDTCNNVGESNSRSNVFQVCLASVCVPSRWKVLSGEFRRRPTALAIRFVQPDRVGRRGLSEPGGIFSRLLTYATPWLYPSRLRR